MKNIWVPLSGQIAQQRKVETIANNIANANTPGFKKDELVFKEHLTALTKGADTIDLPRKEWNPDDFYRSQGAENAYVKVDGSYTDFKQGELQPTNNAFDFALFGKGFFEVLTPNGVRFTRNGSFSLNQNGEIVNNQGHKLLSPLKGSGKAEELPEETSIDKRIIKVPTTKKISVSNEGEIFTAQGKIGQFSVVEFKDIHALRKQGQGLYINNADNNIIREEIKTAVKQGFVEGSNVNAVKEMSELIKAHRHFENIQKAISTYDSMNGRGINDIATF